jgi:hypothetical protein
VLPRRGEVACRLDRAGSRELDPVVSNLSTWLRFSDPYALLLVYLLPANLGLMEEEPPSPPTVLTLV